MGQSVQLCLIHVGHETGAPRCKALCAGLAAEEEREEGVSSTRLTSGQVAVYMEGLDSSMPPAAATQGGQDSRTSRASVDEGHGKKKGPKLFGGPLTSGLQGGHSCHNCQEFKGKTNSTA